MSTATSKRTRKRAKPNLDQAERNTLILGHMSLVNQALGRISAHLPAHVDRRDLLEAGMIGLVDAAHRFDPARKVRFSTYAITRIRGAIFDALREEDWLPRSMRNEISRLEEARRNIEQKTHAPATARQLSLSLKIPRQKVEKLTRVAEKCGFQSLNDVPAGFLDQQTASLHHQRNMEFEPTQRAVFAEQKKLLAEAITRLPKNERLVISLYYFEQMNLREIADIFGVTNSRVCQIHRAALRRLQQKLDPSRSAALVAV